MAWADNPILTVLGRRGRAAIVATLRDHPDTAWSGRELAAAAGVSPMATSRTVKELAALGLVETFRPGRASVVRWRSDSVAARLVAAIDPPDLRAGAETAFAAAYEGPPGSRLVAWRAPGDDPADPLTPTRIAAVTRRPDDEDAGLDAVGPALDATFAGGWPVPDVTVIARADLDDDETAQAILAGRPLGQPPKT